MIDPFHVLSFILSTILAFFTTALGVHAIIYCLRIRTYRIRHFLRLLPFAGILLDFLAFNNNLSNWLNPLSCSSCTQKAFLTFLPDLQHYLSTHQISLLHYLAIKDSLNLGWALVILMGCISLFLTGRKLLQIFYTNHYVIALIKKAKSYESCLTNERLISLIRLHKLEIVVSQKIHVPMAFINTIVLPEEMYKLTQREQEVVIAHELEHIRWKDSLLKMFIHVFVSLFWWIPIKNWIKIMEEEQELSCDQEAVKYNFSGKFLASALVKITTSAKESRLTNVCLFKKKNRLLKRMKAALTDYPREQFTTMGAFIIFFGLVLLTLCF